MDVLAGRPDFTRVFPGSARASRLRDDEAAMAAQARAACGAPPQSCSCGLRDSVVRADAESVGEAPTGNLRQETCLLSP